jgi:chromosome segregation ATPase
MEKQIFNLADNFRKLKEQKVNLEQELKDLNPKLEEAQAQLLDAMLTTETASFNYDGYNFVMATTEYPGAVAERKDELWEVMRNNGFDNLFTINSQTLRGVIGNLKDENDGKLPDWLDGLIAPNEKTIIRLTKGRKISC